jgi:hypothetical protein
VPPQTRFRLDWGGMLEEPLELAVADRATADDKFMDE